MTKKEVKEQLNFSFEKLTYECIRKADFVKLDISKFVCHGYTYKNLTAFRQQIQEFTTKKFDNIYQINIRHLDKIISALERKIKTVMCDIRIVAFCTWNKDHYKYKQFKQFNRKINCLYDLSTTFCKMIELVNLDVEEFISSGLNENTIYTAEELQTNFNSAISARNDAIIQRDIAEHNKLIEACKLSNNLYFICNLGKQIWQNIDEARYKDYSTPYKDYEAQKIEKQKTNDLEVAA